MLWLLAPLCSYMMLELLILRFAGSCGEPIVKTPYATNYVSFACFIFHVFFWCAACHGKQQVGSFSISMFHYLINKMILSLKPSKFHRRGAALGFKW